MLGPVPAAPSQGGCPVLVWKHEAMASTPPASYRRSTGSARGQARKEALLRAVVEDLAANGLASHSLRRAARAAGTTHKVLLYHFDGLEDLLGQALPRLRERRVSNAAKAVAPAASLADRVRTVWPVLMDDTTGVRVIDEAIGLAMYDPARYAHLSRGAAESYLPALEAWCPTQWSEQRKARGLPAHRGHPAGMSGRVAHHQGHGQYLPGTGSPRPSARTRGTQRMRETMKRICPKMSPQVAR